MTDPVSGPFLVFGGGSPLLLVFANGVYGKLILLSDILQKSSRSIGNRIRFRTQNIRQPAYRLQQTSKAQVCTYAFQCMGSAERPCPIPVFHLPAKVMKARVIWKAGSKALNQAQIWEPLANLSVIPSQFPITLFHRHERPSLAIPKYPSVPNQKLRSGKTGATWGFSILTEI